MNALNGTKVDIKKLEIYFQCYCKRLCTQILCFRHLVFPNVNILVSLMKICAQFVEKSYSTWTSITAF